PNAAMSITVFESRWVWSLVEVSPRSDKLEVCGRGLAALHRHLVAHLLPVIQATQAGCLDCRDVHEHVLAAIFGHDETEAFCGVEPLYRADSHSCVTFSVSGTAQQRAARQTTGPLERLEGTRHPSGSRRRAQQA